MSSELFNSSATVHLPKISFSESVNFRELYKGLAVAVSVIIPYTAPN